MRKAALLAIALASHLATLPLASPAGAQVARTWVSGTGNDANPCSRTAPCKTFAGAITKTAAGGFISVLDPGAYGTVIISKSISIINDGVGEAGIVAAGTTGITVNAPGEVVTLRGLTIHGAPGTGLNGINFVAGLSLHIENCVIRNFNAIKNNGFGISFTPNSASHLFISDTIVSNNGPNFGGGKLIKIVSGGGILIKPTGTGTTAVTLNNVQVLASGAVGLQADAAGLTSGKVSVTLRNSVVSAGGGDGIVALAAGGSATSVVTVDRSSSVNNAGSGVFANGTGGFVVLNGAALTGNNLGMGSTGGGQVCTYGNNVINDNVSGGGTASCTLTLQ